MLKFLIFLVIVTRISCGDVGLQFDENTGYASKYQDYKPRDYHFSYAVSDPHTGDHKSQWEVKENGVVRGGYSLLEPDGTTRLVEYIADDHGFRAVVKKIGTAIHPDHYETHGNVQLPELEPIYAHYKAYDGQINNYASSYLEHVPIEISSSVHAPEQPLEIPSSVHAPEQPLEIPSSVHAPEQPLEISPPVKTVEQLPSADLYIPEQPPEISAPIKIPEQPLEIPSSVHVPPQHLQPISIQVPYSVHLQQEQPLEIHPQPEQPLEVHAQPEQPQSFETIHVQPEPIPYQLQQPLLYKDHQVYGEIPVSVHQQVGSQPIATGYIGKGREQYLELKQTISNVPELISISPSYQMTVEYHGMTGNPEDDLPYSQEYHADSSEKVQKVVPAPAMKKEERL